MLNFLGQMAISIIVASVVIIAVAFLLDELFDRW